MENITIEEQMELCTKDISTYIRGGNVRVSEPVEKLKEMFNDSRGFNYVRSSKNVEGISTHAESLDDTEIMKCMRNAIATVFNLVISMTKLETKPEKIKVNTEDEITEKTFEDFERVLEFFRGYKTEVTIQIRNAVMEFMKDGLLINTDISKFGFDKEDKLFLILKHEKQTTRMEPTSNF